MRQCLKLHWGAGSLGLLKLQSAMRHLHFHFVNRRVEFCVAFRVVSRFVFCGASSYGL